jgi:hypothetical protein
LIVGAAAAVGLLQVLGALQVRSEPYRGYRTLGDGAIIQVADGSPADRAGLEVGDRLIRIDGIGAGDRRADEARLRVRIGQTQTIVVDRGGRAVEVHLVVTGLPPMEIAAYLVSVLTGLSFLACGLWAYLTAPRLATRLLAIAGIGVGGVFTEMPYFASPAARTIQETGLIVAGVLGFGALFHLMLALSGARALLGRKAAALAIYMPAAIVCAGKIVATVLAGGHRTDLTDLTTTLSLVLVLLYFCLAIAAFLLGYASAARVERTASGLNVLGVCLLLGLAPMIPTAIGLVAPAAVFPGGDYYDVVWVLIPFALTRAVVLQGRREREEARPRSEGP